MTKPQRAAANGPQVSGPRTLLPVHLLFSPHHSELDLVVWATLDVYSRTERDGVRGLPADAGREYLADRWQVSVSGIAKALARLSRPHKGRSDTEPDAPVFLATTRRGYGLNALRSVIAGIPPVHVPAASLGYGRPAVSPRAWRLYAAYLWLRHHWYATVALSHAQVAAALHWKRETVVKYLRELVDAGFVVTRERVGRPTIVAPLLALTPAGLAAAERRADRVAARTAPAPVDNPVDHAPAEVMAAEAPSPLAGTSPHPPAGTAPSPPAGTSFLIGDPAYGDPDYENLAPTRHRPLRGGAQPGGWTPAAPGVHAPTPDPDNPGCCLCRRLLISANTLHSATATPLPLPALRRVA
jgi:hypothetical protein